jgi:hypothetical protein
MKLSTVSKVLCSTLITSLALAAGTASAGDVKIYPGEMCNPSGDDSGVQHYWGRVRNNTAFSLGFECPVVRDVVNLGVLGGRAWVVDNHSTQQVACTLMMVRADTGTLTSSPFGDYFFSTRISAGAGAAPQALLDFAALNPINDGYLSMSCTVPGIDLGVNKSGIVAYRVNEDT